MYVSASDCGDVFFVMFYAKNRINNTIAAADLELVWTNSGNIAHRRSKIDVLCQVYAIGAKLYRRDGSNSYIILFKNQSSKRDKSYKKSIYKDKNIQKNSNVWTLEIYVLMSKIIASIKIYIKYQRDVSAWTIKKIGISNTKTPSILWDNAVNTVRSIHNAEVA